MLKTKEYLKGWIPFYIQRFYFYIFATVANLIIPWITIDGNHLFLLHLEKMQLHLLGVSFDMQEMYLLVFILVIFFIFIYFITVLGGRLFCGWGCPQTMFITIYRDLIQDRLFNLRDRKNKQKEIDFSKPGNKKKFFYGVLIWVLLSFLAASNLTWYFIPPQDFFAYLLEINEHPILFGTVFFSALFLIYDVLYMQEKWCTNVCPYVRVQSSLYDHDTIYPIYTEKRGGIIFDKKNDVKLWKKPPGENDECTGCEACVRVCPTHIDIRKGQQLECINCLECVDACTKVMGALGKETLVGWWSNRSYEDNEKTKFIRFKTVAYVVIMVITLLGTLYMGSNRDAMLLNINKSSRLYSIEDDKSVINDYIFLFVNTDQKSHNLIFEIENNDDIEIVRPKEPFLAVPGKKVKKVVVLRAKKDISKFDDKNTKIHLKIRAYAVDDKDKIFVLREGVFIYPPKSDIK